MICPVCQAENQKSRVNLVDVLAAPKPVEKYYDTDGTFHQHDPNAKMFRWRCTRGHAGIAQTTMSCPSAREGCGHNGGVVIRVDDPLKQHQL